MYMCVCKYTTRVTDLIWMMEGDAIVKTTELKSS